MRGKLRKFKLLLSVSSFDPPGILSIDDLHQVQKATWEARAKWYSCGLALGLTAGTLDAIRETHGGDCYTETLKEWLKRADLHPSWRALCNALKSPPVGYVELAEKLSKQHVKN